MNNILIYIIIITVIFIILIKYNEYKITDKNIINYEFKTGDIILTNENGPLSYIVSLFAGYRYSHCYIVIDGKKKLVAHSHILNNSNKDIAHLILTKNEIKNKYYNKNSGVIIESFDILLKKQNIKEFTILPIKNEIDNIKMLNTYTQFMNKPYKQSILELINVNNNLFKNKRNNTSLFCSEFIIELLQSLDIIDKNIVSNTISPDELLRLNSYNKDKLVNIKINMNSNIFINSIIYQFLLFIRLPIILINNFLSSI